MFNQDQLDDLAWLLANLRTLADIKRLAESLDPATVPANDLKDQDVFAQKVVQALQVKQLVPLAVDQLLTEGHPTGPMAVGLRHILANERLNSVAALQALTNEYEPFMSSADMIELLPKVARRVCAIALGTTYNKIRGTGFLIAPDVVITNFHVVEPFLQKDNATGEFKTIAKGSELFFFFDYLKAPTPKVPPPESGKVTAADDWFIYGRDRLANDGLPTSPKEIKNNELDYVLIRLSRPVGSLSARAGGGSIRGWLPLEDVIDVDSAGKRLLVVQHPSALPQLFDIGNYEGMDPSRTRVRYSVSTAQGSSGGAAVGTDGRLFALHNAEVRDPAPGAKRVNQGVRIDLITKDVGAKIPPKQQPDEDNKLLWSLNDDFRNSRPIIGRKRFRDHVTQLNVSDVTRALVVTGTPPAGLQFSIKLLNRLRLPDIRVVEFSANELQQPINQGFIPKLLRDLNISGANRPESLKTEAEDRWVGDIAKWFANALAIDQEQNKMKYPAWIVMNTVMPNEESFPWPLYLEDLIAALLGRRNDQNIALDVPQLRWLFLATPKTNLPLAGINRLNENLDDDTKYEDEFEECYLNANKALDLRTQQTGLLRPFALKCLDDNRHKVPALAPRKALALLIQELLRYAAPPGN